MKTTEHVERGAEYYDEIYRGGYDTSGYYPLYQIVMQLLERYHNPRVLELGCGIGDLGRLIIDKGYPYRGLDFSEEAVQQSRARCPGGDFRPGNVYNPDDYRPCDYNVVVALEVLEHVDDLQLVQNIPFGARLIASVPNYDDAAHLRLYHDPQKDIVERFRPYLHVVEVGSATSDKLVRGTRPTIHIFSGIRIIP